MPVPDYLLVNVEEDFGRERAGEMAKAVQVQVGQTGVRQVLYDLRRARNEDSLSNSFFFAHEDAPRLELDKTLRVALLVHPMDKSHDFAETVLRNTGHNVRKFYDEQKAVAWLGKSGN